MMTIIVLVSAGLWTYVLVGNACTEPVSVSGIAESWPFDGSGITVSGIREGPDGPVREPRSIRPAAPIPVGIIRTAYPFGLDSTESVLAAAGLSYNVLDQAFVENHLPLEPYTKIIVASNQNAELLAVLNTTATRTWLEEYLSDGGIVEIHADAHGSIGQSWDLLPGGVRILNPWTTYDSAVLTNRTDAFTNYPMQVNITGLTDLGMPVSYGSINKSSLPPGGLILAGLGTSPGSNPVLVRLPMGNGTLILTTIPLERLQAVGSPALHRNIILYGTYNGTTVAPVQSEMRLLPDAIAPGESVRFRIRVFSFGRPSVNTVTLHPIGPDGSFGPVLRTFTLFVLGGLLFGADQDPGLSEGSYGVRFLSRDSNTGLSSSVNLTGPLVVGDLYHRVQYRVESPHPYSAVILSISVGMNITGAPIPNPSWAVKLRVHFSVFELNPAGSEVPFHYVRLSENGVTIENLTDRDAIDVPGYRKIGNDTWSAWCDGGSLSAELILAQPAGTNYYGFSIDEYQWLEGSDEIGPTLTDLEIYPGPVSSGRIVIYRGEHLFVSVRVSDNRSGVSEVRAAFLHVDLSTVQLSGTLHDDGMHGDGAMNDGLFAGTIATSGLALGDYHVGALARDAGPFRANNTLVAAGAVYRITELTEFNRSIGADINHFNETVAIDGKIQVSVMSGRARFLIVTCYDNFTVGPAGNRGSFVFECGSGGLTVRARFSFPDSVSFDWCLYRFDPARGQWIQDRTVLLLNVTGRYLESEFAIDGSAPIYYSILPGFGSFSEGRLTDEESALLVIVTIIAVAAGVAVFFLLARYSRTADLFRPPPSSTGNGSGSIGPIFHRSGSPSRPEARTGIGEGNTSSRK